MDMIVRVDTAESARELAALLNSSTRSHPIVVVSTPAGRSSPYIDAEHIKRELGNLAPVYLIPTGEVSWEFSAQMADMTQVYGGAGRAGNGLTNFTNLFHPRTGQLYGGVLGF